MTLSKRPQSTQILRGRILKSFFIIVCSLVWTSLTLQIFCFATVAYAQQLSDFTYRGGIGFKISGPVHQPLAGSDFQYPRADRNNWWQPAFSVDAFSRLDEIWNSHKVKHGQASSLRRLKSEPEFKYNSQGFMGTSVQSLDGYFQKNPVTGLILIKEGQILVERYQYNRNDHQRMTSFSMAKTLIAMMVGLAIQDGHIHSVEDKAEIYVKALKGTAYGETPLRHLLTMSSGVQFREEYDAQDDATRLSRATFVGQTAGGVEATKLFNQRIAAPGSHWYYASAETYVLALVLRSSIGKPLADYFAEKIWIPIGAEADASFIIDASGNEVGFMGFNAVLRDYARLGIMMAQQGRFNGKQIIPYAWWREMTRAHFTPAQTGRWFGYGYQTWIFPSNDGSFAFLGVRGQSIFVDPVNQLVLVQTAVRPLARDPGGADTTALWRAFKNNFTR
jgi:CubicO group peptidase (beta-lactamase class C family)